MQVNGNGNGNGGNSFIVNNSDDLNVKLDFDPNKDSVNLQYRVNHTLILSQSRGIFNAPSSNDPIDTNKNIIQHSKNNGVNSALEIKIHNFVEIINSAPKSNSQEKPISSSDRLVVGEKVEPKEKVDIVEPQSVLPPLQISPLSEKQPPAKVEVMQPARVKMNYPIPSCEIGCPTKSEKIKKSKDVLNLVNIHRLNDKNNLQSIKIRENKGRFDAVISAKGQSGNLLFNELNKHLPNVGKKDSKIILIDQSNNQIKQFLEYITQNNTISAQSRSKINKWMQSHKV